MLIFFSGVTAHEQKNSYLEPAFVTFMGVSVVLGSILAYWMYFAQSNILRRFAWGVSGGFVTGYQNFIKDSITIVTVSGDVRPWKLPWYFFILMALNGLTVYGGLFILSACMKRYDATYSSGSFAGGMMLSASIMSAVHYDTFSHLDPGLSNHVLYPTGLVIVMFGVGLLINHSKDGSVGIQEESDDSNDMVEADVMQSSSDVNRTIRLRKHHVV